MLIPEVIIYNTVSKFVRLVQQDFDLAAGEQCSMLYSMFKVDDNGDDLVHETHDWFTQAKSIFLKDNDSERSLKLNMGYNREQAAAPTIHIILPSENKGRYDSLGLDETDPVIDMPCGNLSITKSTTHTSVYHLMITSDNVHEVMIVHYFMKAMFVIFHDHFSLLGLTNLKFSGQDIAFQPNLPPNIYHRNMSIEFDWESKVNIKLNETLVESLKFTICTDMALDIANYQSGIVDPAQ